MRGTLADAIGFWIEARPNMRISPLALIVLVAAIGYVTSEVREARRALRSGRISSDYAKAIRRWMLAGAICVLWWLGMMLMIKSHASLAAWRVYWIVGFGCFLHLLVAAQRMRGRRRMGAES